MGLFNAKQLNNSTQSGNSNISQVDQNCKDAEAAVNMAIFELGSKYYEANKNNSESELYDMINKVNDLKNKSKLWYQYKLSLEGKMQCEACGAIITSDSAFCNKCGVSIKPIDFSSIVEVPVQQVVNTASRVCPSCGNPVEADDAFCEKCGQKI